MVLSFDLAKNIVRERFSFLPHLFPFYSLSFRNIYLSCSVGSCDFVDVVILLVMVC